MATLLGRNSRIKKNGVVIAKMTSMSLTINNESLDITSFGDTWNKLAIGMRNWSGSISGHFVKDNTEQNALRSANLNGTEITDIEFWVDAVDATCYYDIDVVTDPEASCIIESFSVTSDNGSVVSFDISITGNGPLRYNSA